MILEQILEKERRLRALHLQLKREPYYSAAVTEKFSQYLDDYCSYNNLTIAEVQNSYNAFIHSYVDDLRAFDESGLYPFQRGDKDELSRQDYDIALILSAFFEKVRHHIFSKVAASYDSLKGGEHLLYIGLGPGLELTLLNNAKVHVDAYDTSFAPFVRSRFSAHNLVEELFVEKKDAYKNIYCIELLEHIPEPEVLISNMASSLVKGGKVYFTTASDMPQFDHLVNFTGRDLTDCITRSGLKILEQTDLWHDYKKAHNTWYVCERL